jgi:hypothetical protein
LYCSRCSRDNTTGLNRSKVLQCADLNRIVLSVLQLPKNTRLADVSAILTDKRGVWS